MNNMQNTSSSSSTPGITGTIRYILSRDGQKADLLAGGSGAREQTVTGQVTRDTIELFAVTPDGKLEIQRIYDSGETDATRNTAGSVQLFDEPQTFDSLVDWITRRRAEELARKKAIGEKNAARMRELLADPDWDGDKPSVSSDYVELVDPELSQRFYEERDRRLAARKEKELEAAAQEFLADPQKIPGYGGGTINSNGSFRLNAWYTFPPDHPASIEARRRFEERKAADDRREAEKQKQIADWVARHGDENQKERFAAGMFPRDEAVAAIKEQAFAPLKEFPEYERIKNGEVRAVCDENCLCAQGYDERCGITCETVDDVPATARQWEQIKRMKALLPAATYTIRKHRCECDDPDCKTGIVERFSIYVKLQVGAFVFNRNYEVEE